MLDYTIKVTTFEKLTQCGPLLNLGVEESFFTLKKAIKVWTRNKIVLRSFFSDIYLA